MKIALVIEGDREQIVLTPETDHEKAVLGGLTNGSRISYIKSGSYYRCQGGWTRQGDSDESTIIVLEDRPDKGAPK